MVGCVFRDMVRDGVVPIGEGVMRLLSTKNANKGHVLDVLDDGRIQWCDESSGGEVVVFQSPLACCARIWNTAVPQRYYERIIVSCGDTSEKRTLKELKDAYVAGEDVSSCHATSVVSVDGPDPMCGIQEYEAALPAWSERGTRSSGLVDGRVCVKRPYSCCADTPTELQQGGKTMVNSACWEEEVPPLKIESQRMLEEEEEEYDGVFEYGLEEEVTVCQPSGVEHGMRHVNAYEDGVKMESGMLDLVRLLPGMRFYIILKYFKSLVV